MASRKDRLSIHQQEGVSVLDLGEMDIWDGADLALLRETLTNLIHEHRCRRVGVNMRHVKYIPSGFFGMLYDWHETGVEIFLYSPQPNVANMLWFRCFFEPVCDGKFVLDGKTCDELVHAPDEAEWTEDPEWEHDNPPDPYAAVGSRNAGIISLPGTPTWENGRRGPGPNRPR